MPFDLMSFDNRYDRFNYSILIMVYLLVQIFDF